MSKYTVVVTDVTSNHEEPDGVLMALVMWEPEKEQVDPRKERAKRVRAQISDQLLELKKSDPDQAAILEAAIPSIIEVGISEAMGPIGHQHQEPQRFVLFKMNRKQYEAVGSPGVGATFEITFEQVKSPRRESG